LLAINEEFYSIQGEGIHTGLPMYFVRLQGCEVGCYFCDTKYTWRPSDQTTAEEDIALRAAESGAEWVCVTGGEPYEQNLARLSAELHKRILKIHIETSGTCNVSGNIDWICLSPKDLFSKKKTIPIFKDIAHEIKCVVTKLADVDYYLDNYLSTYSKTPFILNMVDNKTDLIAEVMEKVKGIPNVRIQHQCHKVMNLR
jgi:7-carboxy-7-deazaguanine synthase